MSPSERYLLWFANENNDFRLPEIESIALLFNIELNWLEGPNESPFWILETTDQNARKIASRSITLRSVIKLWGSGKTMDELHNNLNCYPKESMRAYLNLSFRIDVETFGKTISMKEKIDKIELFNYLPIDGPVKLNNPDLHLYIIEYYGLKSSDVPNEPYNLYFGIWICDGQRNLITKYSLKKRKFIGNTSMDPQLSLIMANQALVKKGDIVLDPFVGTGALLVAAAHFGAYVLGVDMNFLMLHGRSRPTRIQDRDKPRGKDESIYSNMKQYGSQNQYLDVIVGDSSLSLWHGNLKFDSIITDPPYGIREASEKIGSIKKYRISPEHLKTHIPSKIDYSISQIFIDLLNLAANHLKLEGRLVSWIPISKAEYNVSDLPNHPCLKLVANSEQFLTGQMNRRLLTWIKIREVTDLSDCGKAKEMFPFGLRQYCFSKSETRKQRNARIARELNEKGLTYFPKNRSKV